MKEECPHYSDKKCMVDMILCDFDKDEFVLCLRYRVHNLKPGIMQLR